VTPEGDGAPIPLKGPVRRLGLVGREGARELPGVLERLVRFAAERELTLLPEASLRAGALGDQSLLEESLDEVDLLVTLGGDGTLLRGVRQVAERTVPVLGVNLGRLGFLTSVPGSEMERALETVLEGGAVVDRRFSLEGQVIHGDGSPGSRIWALNDLVLHKRGVARVVGLDLSVEEGGAKQAIGSFTGDGVIVASPTGSTAYSLSAGGPIIAPGTGCVVVTPISPHTMAMRPLVLPDHVHLSIQAVDRAEDLVLTGDGQVAVDLAAEERVQVEKSARSVDLVRLPDQTFFDTLRRKLNWAV